MTNLSRTNLNSRSAAGPGRGEGKESPGSLPRYAEYKDSGVASLGLVPSHWQIKRLRFVAEFNPSKSEVARLDRQMDVSFLAMDAIGDDGTIRLDEARTLAQVENGYTYFRDGDVVIAKITPCFENGKGGFVRGLLNGVGFGTTELIVVRPKPKATSGDYLEWLFASPTFRKDAEGAMYGAGGQKRVPDSFVRDYLDAVPPIEEQSAIATFLDRETGKIDALIAEQEKLLTLLAEKRQATISHAVTRGLNPNAKMKDSGVRWLGEVPAHWEITSLGRISVSRCDGPFGSGIKSDHYTEEGALVVRLQNIRGYAFNIGEPVYLDQAYFETSLRGHEVVGGDLLVAGLGDDNNLLGRACVAPEGLGAALVKADCFRFRLRAEKAMPDFVAMQLSAGAAFDAGVMATGTTRSRMPLGVMASRKVALPPVHEQSEIITFVDAKLSKFDVLKEQAEAGIALLKERRSVLIAAAVTGKIDVRGSVPIQVEPKSHEETV